MKMAKDYIEIMDTTLRDGEQTSGLAFSESEKLNTAKLLLEELKVDRIEIASARVSEGEFNAVKKTTEWAKSHNYLDRIEVLGFVDGTHSIDWIRDAGARVINLLCKGSLKHVKGQLKKSPEEHLEDVKNSIHYATSQGLKVNVYLEDWSNGMRHSPEYVHFLTQALASENVERIMLPDTLGILNHEETYTFCKKMVDTYPGVHFDFHAHNDYDLSTANAYASLKAGVSGIHTTVNGLGERAGNVPLASVAGIILDHLKLKINLNENKINKISRIVETFSGIRIPTNKPLVGEYVFTQTCGVHADGDSKENLYFNDLTPERFGRVRKYALGKTAGKANIKMNLQELGIELDPETMKKVTARVIELGDQKEDVTAEDLPYIISDILKSEKIQDTVKILNYTLNLSNNLRPVATLSIEIDGEAYQESSQGDGQYDAFMRALRNIYCKLDKDFPRLVDYVVTIPPGGRTDALVGAIITWENGRTFKTRGVDPDQTVAAIKATMKMLNIMEQLETAKKQAETRTS